MLLNSIVCCVGLLSVQIVLMQLAIFLALLLTVSSLWVTILGENKLSMHVGGASYNFDMLSGIRYFQFSCMLNFKNFR
jgi:hypothetical protein